MRQAIAIVLLTCFAAAAPAQQKSAAGGRTANLPDFTSLMKQQGPAVVNVITKREQQPARGNTRAPQGEDPLQEFFRRFMPDAPERERGAPGAGLGSGFIISADGYVLTNAHVVAGDGQVTVRLADAKREYKAKVIGTDERTDIALLKIEASGLPTVKLGKSASLQPGEWVAAIGSPFGFENTITAGIVSATGRSLPAETYVPFIQTDVAVNPGNSGGPLINLAGEVVGVNSMIYSQTGGYMGVSFAIPIDVAMDVARQLRAFGKVTRGRIGVRLQEVTTDLARAFQLPRTAGALVLDVFKGSGAARAAIIPGDVIVRFAGQPIETDGDLVRLTAAAKPGTYVDLELVRFGAPLTARVRVDEARGPAMPPAPPQMSERDLAGLKVGPLSAQQRQRLHVDGGVMVEMPGPVGRQAGLQRGDVVLSVNGKTVSSAEGFRSALGAAGKGGTVALLVQRDGARQFLPLRLPR